LHFSPRNGWRPDCAGKEVDFGGKNLTEIAYGWRDLSAFGKMVKVKFR
jgi:hypothetical protein